jgi:hypothetical protein
MLALEPSRLVARIGDAELTLFVDTLSGTFSMASKQLGDVASKNGVLNPIPLFFVPVYCADSSNLCTILLPEPHSFILCSSLLC